MTRQDRKAIMVLVPFLVGVFYLFMSFLPALVRPLPAPPISSAVELKEDMLPVQVAEHIEVADTVAQLVRSIHEDLDGERVVPAADRSASEASYAPPPRGSAAHADTHKLTPQKAHSLKHKHHHKHRSHHATHEATGGGKGGSVPGGADRHLLQSAV